MYTAKAVLPRKQSIIGLYLPKAMLLALTTNRKIRGKRKVNFHDFSIFTVRDMILLF